MKQLYLFLLLWIPFFALSNNNAGTTPVNLNNGTPPPTVIKYVKVNGTGNGSSWATAMGDLQAAINETGVNEVWVAAGEYQPTSSGQSFIMKEGVKIYGGFPASDDPGWADRDWEANKTTLKGNGNSVIRNIGNNLTKAAVLDGFILTGGNATSAGGGMYNSSSSPTLTNVTISRNTATNGGGMYNLSSSSPTLVNVVLSENTATNNGGGMFNNSSSPTLTNVVLSENTATNNGGGIYNLFSSSPTLTNMVLSQNAATNNGGGIYNGEGSTPKIRNSIVFGNNSGIVNDGTSSTDIKHSLIQGRDIIADGNIAASTIGSVADIFTDPANAKYSLKARSPVIDAGDNGHYNTVLYGDKDIAGNPRILGSTIDMGAYESPEIQIVPDAENILYVNQNVSLGNGAGNSWENAIPELADALKWARKKYDASPADPGWTEGAPLKIYVAKGVYKPKYNAADGKYDIDGNRDNAFVMVKNVQLYGGFDPDKEITDLSHQRIIPSLAVPSPANGTILSGDIDSNDAANGTIKGDNAYHVVLSAGDVGLALLDGFTIQGGNANGGSSITVNGQAILRENGGGMHNHTSSPTITNITISGNAVEYYGGGIYNHTSSPTITNVTISGNTSDEGDGGGMYNHASSPTITNVTISGNKTMYSGSGMYNRASSPTITNAVISGNTVEYDGGGMYNYNSSPTLKNVEISGNVAGDKGGGMLNYNSSPTLTNVVLSENTAVNSGGGMSNTGSTSKPILTNVRISGNKAKDGGGMYNFSSSSPILTNMEISGNEATTNGGGMYTSLSSPILTNVTISGNTAKSGREWYRSGGNPVIRNSIIYGNGIVGALSNNEYSLIQGVENTDKGNIKASTISSVADIFTDPDKGDYSLKARSLVIDAGNNAHYNSVLYGDKDIAGNPRILGSTIDMGAYESPEIQIVPDAENILYVNQQVSAGNGAGNSWENAIPELADALKWAREQHDANPADPGWTEGEPLKIYVAKGVYKPLYNAADGQYTNNGGRDNAFVMVKNVRLYGGFDPEHGIEKLNEENDRRILPAFSPVIPSGAEESPATGTILSGDIDVVSGISDGDAYHVVVSVGEVGKALLDGFTIQGGNANYSDYNNITVNGQNVERYFGGGMYNYDSSPTLRNVEISGNKALYAGGILNSSSSPTLTNVTISGNTADEGGAMYNLSSSSPTLTNVVLSENTATNNGGGMFNSSSSPTLTNVVLSENTATTNGGGMYNLFSSSPTLTNVTISGNTAAESGGGIYNLFSSSPTLTNVTISGNTAESGGGIYNQDGSIPKIRNSIVFGNNSGIVNRSTSSNDIKHSLVQGEAGGSDGNLDGTDDAYTSEKVFESPIDPGLSSGGNYRLKSTSPVINKGSDDYYGLSEVPDLSGITTDLDGNNRFNGRVDMGAFERQMKQQEFVFSNLLDDEIITTYGDADFSPATAIEEVVYTVPATNGVVEIISGKIHILGAGEVEVTLNAAGNSEYDPAVELTKVLKVGKKGLTATALEVTKVYGGADPVLTYTLSSVLVGSDAFTGVLERAAGEDVGTYAIGQGTLTLNDNYELTFVPNSLQILESEIEGIGFAGKTVVYNGASHLLEVRGLPEDASVTYENNGQINADTYTVTATISRPNHGDLMLTAVLTVQKAQALITAEERQEHGYDGTIKNITAGSDHSETILAYSPQQGYTNAGTYNITVSAAETANYLATSKQVALVIRQGQPADRLVLEDRTVTYDGKAHFLEVKNLPTGANVAYGNNGQVNAGTYEVTARVTHPDYKEETLTARLTIRKAGQQIRFREIGKLLRDVGHVELEVGSDSGLQVNLHSSDGLVATISGKDLLVHRLGTTRITATQEGDGNHEAAEPVAITVTVEDGIEEGAVHVHRALSPNGDGINDFLIVEGIKDFPENRLQVLSSNQLVVFDMEGYDNDSRAFRGISNTTGSGGMLPEGTYFYVVRYKTSTGWKTNKGWFVQKVRR